MKGIPYDQRAIRTIAKIGGLVDKTMAIYEGTRFNRDYVRVKIACRNVELVPPSAECTLDMFLYDFFFEREVPQMERQDNLKTRIPTETPRPQPSPKKQKTDPAGGRKNMKLPKTQTK